MEKPSYGDTKRTAEGPQNGLGTKKKGRTMRRAPDLRQNFRDKGVRRARNGLKEESGPTADGRPCEREA